MGQIRVVLIFNEDNERQKEIGEYLKSQKRCKTALITELVYAWLHKEHNFIIIIIILVKKNRRAFIIGFKMSKEKLWT